jgi:hypothetical protein
MSPLSFRGELRQRVLDVTHQDAGAFMVWQFVTCDAVATPGAESCGCDLKQSGRLIAFDRIGGKS